MTGDSRVALAVSREVLMRITLTFGDIMLALIAIALWGLVLFGENWIS